MERQFIKTQGYNSDKFFRVNKMKRYTNDSNNGRYVTLEPALSEDYHLYFCSYGRMSIENGSESFLLDKFDLLIYKPRVKQEIISPHMGNYVHCIFSGSKAEEILIDLDLALGKIYHITPEYTTGEKFLFYGRQIEYVLGEYNKKKEYSELSCACMLIEFLSLYSRNRDKATPEPSFLIIKKAISQLHDCMVHSKWSDVDNIIKSSNMSKSHFYRLFKKYTGTTPHGFLTNCRMTAAADYLTLYNIKIKEISEKLGFDDPLYFSRIFKQSFGMSPKKYRELNKIHRHIDNNPELK